MASGYVKRSTALVGLAVSKAPREALTKLYKETLVVLGSMPKSAQYRIHTEQITKQRLDVVEQESDIPQLEHKLGAGQIEEVIQQVGRRMSCLWPRKMQDWQPWEPLQKPPPADQWTVAMTVAGWKNLFSEDIGFGSKCK
ncbi:LOW QUALITY PROTEIN: NADH dehydrogenase [ubiquinone] 1 alpha subcomplex subunit 5 [Pocillopora verrucosa]|uniref:LOW QUALITY PROTEIN: NADH dehydrogenase [ubiquinone] 1 alpha subcomplex subunit 5 n=1 Tax=Pocillopora verrucosa TaxID=203993 RepID=UPI0033403B45